MCGDERLIYVIDDNDKVRATLVEMIAACGFCPLAVPAVSLREELRRRRPRAIVSDIMMPEQDGLDVVEHVAQRAPDVPLLLVSGYGHRFLQMARRRAQDGGLRHCEARSKPLRLSELRRFLQDATGRDAAP
jgi:FixJ family two-component response regulator